jgi:hypothetical protein
MVNILYLIYSNFAIDGQQDFNINLIVIFTIIMIAYVWPESSVD